MSGHYSNVSVHQNQRVYDVFLQDLSTIQSSKTFASNSYLGDQVFSLLFINELKFYFAENGNVINITLPHTFEVTSAQNVFLIQADPSVLGIKGYIVIAFGLNNHMLIHIDSQYVQPQSFGYQIVWLKEYTQIQMNNQRDCVSVVKQGEITSSFAPRTNLPVQDLTFFLGLASQQKVVHLKISLRMDIEMSARSLSSILTSTEENVVHEETKGLVSRVSNFFSSKLGYRGEAEETSGCVKDIQVFNYFVVIITNKDVIIIRRVDGLKLFEKEYIDSMKQWSARHDQYQNLNMMRDILDFQLVTSSSVYLRQTNSICINLFALKTQMVQSSQNYQTVKQTHIIHKPMIFLLNDAQTEIEEKVEHGAGVYFIYDLGKFSDQDVIKAYSFSYELLSQTNVDVNTLLFLEYTNGKTIAIDHSLQNSLEDLQQLRSLKLHGINAFTYVDQNIGELKVQVTLIASNDVLIYDLFTATEKFSQIQPESKAEGLRIPPIGNLPAGRPAQSFIQRDQEVRIFNREELKPHIFSLLEKIATYKFGVYSRSQDSYDDVLAQIQGEIRESLDIQLNQVSKLDYISEIRDILLQALDLQINDNHFQTNLNNSNDVQQVFQDEGLVQASLESKGKKLEVIEEFLLRFLISENLMQRDQTDNEMIELISSLRFKLFIAQTLRNIQESIKDEGSNSLRMQQYYPLPMRLLSRAIQQTASNIGYNREKLSQLGITSATIVYSRVSQFENVIQTLLELSLNQNIQYDIQLYQGENSSQIAHEGAKILIQILEEVLKKEDDLQLIDTFFRDQNILQSMFNLCQKLSQSIQESEANQVMKPSLSAYADLFMIALNRLNVQGEEQYKIWLNNLVVFIEESISPLEALDFAQKYEARDLLCRLVFDLGKSKYDYILNNVERWENFLLDAMEMIYALEKSALEERRQGNASGPYRGLQMFNIFEELYFPQLKEYLIPRNKKLLALLMLRHQESDEVNILLKEEVIPSITGVDSMKVFSSLAIINNENCVQATTVACKLEDNAFYTANLNLAETQSSVLPDYPQLMPITVDYLNTAYRTLLQNKEPIESVLQRMFALINNQAPERDDFNVMRLFIWRTVANADERQISKVQEMTHQDSQEFNVYTDQQIQNAIQNTLLYRFAEQQQRNLAQLDEAIQATIVEESYDLKRGLKSIFTLMRQRFGNLFNVQAPISTNQSLFHN